jgi:hypothetical protein
MVKELTIEDFLPCLQSAFPISLQGIGTVDLTLVDIEDRRTREEGAPVGRRPFSLIFRGAFLGPEGNRYLPQRMYTMENEKLGRLEIFIVPIGPDGDGMRYEAVFN